MITDLPVGRALRRFRRLNGIKQSHLAEQLGVSQGSVSRWEGGIHEPEQMHVKRVRDFIAASANCRADAALKRLVTHSTLPIHLICDVTHVLLAASIAREAEWRTSAGPFLGDSLWRFATNAIAAAEGELVDRGWFDGSIADRLSVPTEGNGSTEMRILPSILEWEQISLADGRVGRLVTTLSFA
jgi:transcriptional regulator with XRE-family HTH domain